jgi:hypothetical protein
MKIMKKDSLIKIYRNRETEDLLMPRIDLKKTKGLGMCQEVSWKQKRE